MKLLLDTHVLLWLSQGTKEISPQAREAVAQSSGAGQVTVSAITFWEVAMLQARGRISLDMPLSRFRDEVRETAGITEIPVDGLVALESVDLPDWPHGDPADRMLVATARLQGSTLLTRDRTILAYSARGFVDTLAA